MAQIDSSGTHYTFADHLGTPQIQMDGSANVYRQAEYEPYGKVWALRAQDVHQPLRLPGQVAEQFDTGANGATERSYNVFRWYRPGWGRYSQADPIGLAGGPNTYAYGQGNSILSLDRLGLLPIPVQDPGHFYYDWMGSGMPAVQAIISESGSSLTLFFQDEDRNTYSFTGPMNLTSVDTANFHAKDIDPCTCQLGDPHWGWGGAWLLGNTPYDENEDPGLGWASIPIRTITGVNHIPVINKRGNPDYGVNVQVHAGGTGLPDWFVSEQQLRPTKGCARASNIFAAVTALIVKHFGHTRW